VLPDSPFPLRRFENSVRCPADRRRPRCPSHEVGRSTECCERRGCKRVGFLAPTMASPFPGEPPWFYLDAVPRPLASPGSSSPELDLLFRVLTAPDLPTPRSVDAFLGVRFPFAASAQRVHWRASFPGLALRSALSVSHALDGLLLSLPCGFISPRNHVRDFLSGVCTCCRARSSRR
jgi:hypothetical protein